MKAKLTLLLVSAFAAVCFAQADSGHKNELALGLGGLPALSRSDTPSLDAGTGVAFQVNHGRRFLNHNKVALYGEINFLASPLRDVSSSVPTATHDFASLYLTPGIRVKFLPTSRISPYTLVGGGYADYEQSRRRIDGQPNSVSRDFYSGSPAYNIATISGGQHNIVATGALVLGWH